MVFTAHVIRGSPVWREWRNRHSLGGDLHGVRFSWTPGDNYVAADRLDKAQVDALAGNTSVRIEMTGVAPPEAVLADPDPVPAEADVRRNKRKN